MKGTVKQNYFRVLGILTMGHILLPIVFANIFFPLSEKYFYLLGWMVSLMVFHPIVFINRKLIGIYLLVLVHLFYLAYGLYEIDANVVWFKTNLQPVFFALLMLLYFNASKDYSGLKIVLTFSVFFIIVTLITSLVGLQQFPLAARELSSDASPELASIYRSLGIAKFGFFYGLSLTVPVFVFFIKAGYPNYSIKYRIIWLFIIILSILGIIEAQFTTAFLFALIGAFIVWREKGKINSLLLQLSLLFIILVLIPGSVFANLFSSVANLIGENTLSERLIDLGITLREGVGSADTHVGFRASRVPFLLNVFIENPLVGSGEDLGHNFWLDELAKYGLIGAIPWVILLKTNIVNNLKLMDNKAKIIYIIIMFLFISIGFMKNIGQKETMIYIFFFIPSLLILKSKRV